MADRRYREIFRDDARANERIRQVHELYERISAKATRAHAAGRRATLPEAELRLIYAVDSIAITAPTRE